MTGLICDEDLYELRRELEADAAEDAIIDEAVARGWKDCEHCALQEECEQQEEGGCEDWELDDDSRFDIQYDRSLKETYRSLMGPI